jgi:hypothetical protein
VRRVSRNYPFGDDVRDGDFGIYLGLHDEGYLVALQAMFPPDIIGYERFHSPGDLRAHWELDRQIPTQIPPTDPDTALLFATDFGYVIASLWFDS